MFIANQDDTIAAIATAPGRGGIGVIKISGNEAVPIARQIFTRSRKQKVGDKTESDEGGQRSEWIKNRLMHGYISDPAHGFVLDEVLLTCMKGPHSYTREDVVEIQGHGGHKVIELIFDLVLRTGARSAEPGEFTQRAFINGRIDLTQAEAIIDIVNAKTEIAVKMATASLKGGLKDDIERVRSNALEAIALLETEIDFSDEMIDDYEITNGSDACGNGGNFTPPLAVQDLISQLENGVLIPLQRMIQSAGQYQAFREGIRTVIIGRPNVGKSSLMNALMKRNRVIVTPMPGTTRDYIEEEIELEGLAITLIDTAGIHQTNDTVETIGIEQTYTCLQNCELALFMVEGHTALSSEDRQIFQRLGGHKAILVVNKSDLAHSEDAIKIPTRWQHLPMVVISAKYRDGIDRLQKLIVRTAVGATRKPDLSRPVPNQRQKNAMMRAAEFTVTALNNLKNSRFVDMVGMDLSDAVRELGMVTGNSSPDEVLDIVFDRFCIGK